MNNVAILTAGNAVYSQKRARKRARIEELTFNPESRRDFLTGFRKRKTQRQQKAAEYAREQARKERIETRKEIREARKAEIDQRLKAINSHLEESDDEGEVLGDTEAKVAKDTIWQSHFEDVEKTTTVTVIEEFDHDGLENSEIIRQTPSSTAVPSEQVPVKPSKPSEPRKKKAFRYGTKAERLTEKRKSKLKKHAHKPRNKRK